MPAGKLRLGTGDASRAAFGLDALNFFVANLQTAFGPFVSVFLTSEAWTQSQIGVVLSIGTVTSMASQVPAGALVDRLVNKRAAAAAAIAAIIAGCLVTAVLPARLPVAAAQVLHGFASCMLGPAIAAISLGAAAASATGAGQRFGRNARWASIGNGLAAALMGYVGYAVSGRAVFFLAAALALPGLWALRVIGPGVGAAAIQQASLRPRGSVGALLRDRALVSFAFCCLLFHLSNAAMLPLAAGVATRLEGRAAELVIAASIVLPQLVVALLSPRVGSAAERLGRRPVLIVGFASLPIRGVLLAFAHSSWSIILIQLLDGISGATFGVMLPLIAADITRGSGRFNLCMGILGLMIGAGATISTTLGGYLADTAVRTAFLVLAGAGALATGLVWLAVPETREVEDGSPMV